MGGEGWGRGTAFAADAQVVMSAGHDGLWGGVGGGALQMLK